MQATYLAHHGVKGMKWGVRRFQNKDGSLTSVGKRRYGYDSQKNGQKDVQQTSTNDTQKKRMSTAKKVAIGAAVVGGVALAAYGAKKYHDHIRDQNAEYHRLRGELLVDAYRHKNSPREFRRKGDLDSYSPYSTGLSTYEYARGARKHDARLAAKTEERIRGYEARQASKDSFRQARKNVASLRDGSPVNRDSYKRNYGLNRESSNNYIRGYRLVEAQDARQDLKKLGYVPKGHRYAPKRSVKPSPLLRADQGAKNLRANGIDPDHFENNRRRKR